MIVHPGDTRLRPTGTAPSTVRDRRWIHRRGVLFEAEVRPPADLPDPSDPSGPSGRPAPGAVDRTRPALVRLSSTFGWPRPLPDWVGMGIRIFDGGGRQTDVLLVSSASDPQLWRQMRPVRHPLACSFSSVVRYAFGGVGQVVVAVPVRPRPVPFAELAPPAPTVCPVAYRLAAAERRGAWRPLGDLVLTGPVDDDPTLGFRPPAAGPGLLTGLRTRVYGWSRS